MLSPKILKIKKFINKSGRLLAINSFDKKLFPYRIKRIFFVDSKKMLSGENMLIYFVHN